MSVFRNLHWYFVGYERQIRQDETGRNRGMKLVYTGRYYTYAPTAEERRRFKAVSLLLTAAVTLFYLVSSLCDWARTYASFVSVVSLAELVPLIYLWVGIVSLQLTPPEMTYRELVGSCRRGKYAATACVIISALTILVDILNLVVQQKLQILARREWVFFFLTICILVCAVILRRWLASHPGSLVPEDRA